MISKSGRTQGRPQSIAWLLRAARGLVLSHRHPKSPLTGPRPPIRLQGATTPLPRTPSPNGAVAHLRRDRGSRHGGAPRPQAPTGPISGYILRVSTKESKVTFSDGLTRSPLQVLPACA